MQEEQQTNEQHMNKCKDCVRCTPYRTSEMYGFCKFIAQLVLLDGANCDEGYERRDDVA